MAKKNPREDGRTIVSDGEIEVIIHGTIGPFYIWTNPMTGNRSAFGYIYGVGAEAKIAMGEILFFKHHDIDFITSDTSGWTVTVAVDQPDPTKSAVRPGGLRPHGRIIDKHFAPEVVAPSDTDRTDR